MQLPKQTNRSLAGLFTALTVVIAMLTLPALSHAEQPPRQEASSDGHKLAITLSPIHLIFPMVEINAEYRVLDKVGVAGIIGIGSTSSSAEDTSGAVIHSAKYSLFEAGVQANYYLLGDFDHGMQAGVEAMLIRASTSSGDVTSSATGVGGGPFLGYKIAASFGLTFVFQAGYQFYSIVAQAEANGSTATASADLSGALVNLNLGWSF